MTIEAALKRDRRIVAAGLAIVFVASSAWTIAGIGMDASAWTMTAMAWTSPGMSMPTAPWTAATAIFVFLMWLMMMAAMMMPSAAPVILLHAAVTRKSGAAPTRSTPAFLGGYLAVWGGFSLAAALAQWGLESTGRANGMMELADPLVSGALLVMAGLYQFSPLKRACLSACQNPVMFVSRNWRPGTAGAFAMGRRHGVDCLGCCWFLMALLFVGGVMNLLWIAAIAAFVALEKFSAGRPALTNAAGVALVAAGLWRWSGALAS
jgi:predicted metal-binding membrane protein